MEKTCAVILAAGNGVRMKSKYPKALCEVLFKPMICWVVDWCRKAGIEDICVVLGDGADLVKKVLPDTCTTVYQEQRLGTGHAIKMAEDFLKLHQGGDVIVLNADAPFLTDETLSNAHRLHESSGAVVTAISAEIENPFGYGRIIRDAAKTENLLEIVEQKDGSAEQLAIKEVNSGAYWFEVSFLLESLDKIGRQNNQNEYYITDTIKIARSEGKIVSVYQSQDETLVLGANDRAGLLKLNTIATKLVIDRLLLNGVNFYCMDGIVISPDAVIGCDTTIAPGTLIKGKVSIGEDCVIGPNTVIENSSIGNGCVIDSSLIESSKVGNGVKIGPNSHLRPNCNIADFVKIGNYVEVKNSNLGEKSSIAHLTYVGDTDMGAHVNMGGGCITCNYNGYHKYRTTIGDHAFIGCNTNLVAPVTVMDGAFTAAGSTIDQNVEADALAIARAKQVNKKGWAVEHKKRNQD